MSIESTSLDGVTLVEDARETGVDFPSYGPSRPYEGAVRVWPATSETGTRTRNLAVNRSVGLDQNSQSEFAAMLRHWL